MRGSAAESFRLVPETETSLVGAGTAKRTAGQEELEMTSTRRPVSSSGRLVAMSA
jgi:hypothetical protein